jgi:hypothetical protein
MPWTSDGRKITNCCKECGRLGVTRHDCPAHPCNDFKKDGLLATGCPVLEDRGREQHQGRSIYIFNESPRSGTHLQRPAKRLGYEFVVVKNRVSAGSSASGRNRFKQHRPRTCYGGNSNTKRNPLTAFKATCESRGTDLILGRVPEAFCVLQVPNCKVQLEQNTRGYHVSDRYNNLYPRSSNHRLSYIEKSQRNSKSRLFTI